MKIGIDLDGTIADNLEILVETFNHHCGKALKGDEIYQYSICKVYDICEDEFIAVMDQKEEEIIKNSPVIPYARENICRLVKDGWQVHIITARNPRYSTVTEKWLRQQGIPYSGLHLLNSHHKVEICRDLKVELMIEDNVHNAYQLADGGIPVILYEAPHNRHWPWQGIRCTSWHDIYASIQKAANK
ncbi:MAG: 5' nucleotidase, NT5C type [Bacillota bacterium]